MINPQYIKLNMIPSGVMPTLYCSQYDVGRPLGLVVYNGNDSVNLSGYTCTIEATRTDKTPVTVAVTTSDNIGVFATTATMTNQADTFRGKLVLVDGNNKRVASLAFVLCVTAKTMDENAEQIQEDASLYQQYNGAVQAMLADIRDRLTIEKRDRISNDTLLQNQIDDLIAPSGEAPSAAEVENARIGWDGTRYQTLGTAIRTQVKNLQDEINGITTHVNLNPTWENGNISTDNGTEFTADNYIRTGYIRMLSEYLRVFLPSDLTHSVDVLVYSGTTAASYTGTYHHISGTYSGIIVKVPLNSYCRFVFWDSNAATPSASAVTINQLYSTDVTLTQAGKPADAKVTGDRIGNLNQLITEDHSSLVAAINEIGMGGGTGLSDDAKLALLACFQKVAWIDDDGQDYYDTLHDALFPTAVSISATFTPGSHVFYETDSLDDLRPYLVVRATMPDSTVKVVTDYFLTGTLTVGTNTITVLYQGLTDTFTVTAQADPAYIEAVFTQPQTAIYTDDSLNSLKSNLVVTYYSAPGATGTVLADSAYTLVGTLTEGTSVITASYQGLTDTFNVTVTASPYIYRLQNTPIEFDGSTGIDTGVQLLSTNRSFTIVLEFVDYRNYTVDQYNNYLFGCYVASSPYTGIFLQEYDGGSQDSGNSRKIRHVLRCTPPGTSGGQVIFDSILPNDSLVGRVVRVAFKYDSTTGNVKAMASVNGTALTPSVSSFSYTYTAINNDLIVGARMGTDGMASFAFGVYNDFRVYDTVLSDAEMQSYIEGVV